MIAKARQAAKIDGLRKALIEAGFCTLDAQSGALGLSQNTTRMILTGRHKAPRLSARIINRILASPDLPPNVRALVLEYVKERLAGLNGHSRR